MCSSIHETSRKSLTRYRSRMSHGCLTGLWSSIKAAISTQIPGPSHDHLALIFLNTTLTFISKTRICNSRRSAMLFISALSAMATALALLTPGTMAADFDVRYSPKKGCGGGAGPVRGLIKGACVPVSSTSVSLRVIDHRSGLKS